jgi:penicillin-binding protein 1A
LRVFGRPIPVLLAILGGAVAVASISMAIYVAALFREIPSAQELADYHPPLSTRVYAWDGTLIGEFSKVRRVYVPYDQMPRRLIYAFLAAEDHNFFSHGSVDVGGLSRAFLKDIVNIMQGRRPEGGSTITQQVAKNILNNNDLSVGRKLKEAVVAGRLEKSLSKPQILELYLNEIWLGYHSYGVGAAAFNYFGKPISDLSLAECAYLAALPKGPDNYQPIRQKAAAIRRRNLVLQNMADLGWVPPAEAAAAMKEDLVVHTGPSQIHYHDADYFVQAAGQEAARLKSVGADLNQGGFYMRTSLDARLQSAARMALMDGLEAYDRRHGWRGAFGHADFGPGWQAAAARLAPPAERKMWQAAIVTSVAGGVRYRTARDDSTGELAGSDVAWSRAGPGAPLKVGDLIFVEPRGAGTANLRQIPAVNGAIVSMDPYSGRVLALVGGYSYSLSNFNRATQAQRQPGSSFKPFVYATALESGQFTPASIVVDGPISLPGLNGEIWSPENFEKRFFGPLPIRRGLELSLNAMTVRIAYKVGMSKIVAAAKRFGVSDHMRPVLAMSLGAGETSPFRLAGGYSVLVNGGRKVSPHLVELVSDRKGHTVYKADERDCPSCAGAFTGEDGPDPPAAGDRVIDPITAYQIVSMLEGVVERGTAVKAKVLGRPVGGKTGTTNDFRSAWFVGFTPQLVTCVFVGFDDNSTLGKDEAGAIAALPIFIDFMQVADKTLPPLDFKPPYNAMFATVGGNREAFRPGTEPRPPPPRLPPPGTGDRLPSNVVTKSGAP